MAKQSLFQKFGRLSEAKKLIIFLLTFAVIGGGYMAYQSFAATPFHLKTTTTYSTSSTSNTSNTTVIGSGEVSQGGKNSQKQCIRLTLQKRERYLNNYTDVKVAQTRQVCGSVNKVLVHSISIPHASSVSLGYPYCAIYRTQAESWLEGQINSKKTSTSAETEICDVWPSHVTYTNQDLKFKAVYPNDWQFRELNLYCRIYDPIKCKEYLLTSSPDAYGLRKTGINTEGIQISVNRGEIKFNKMLDTLATYSKSLTNNGWQQSDVVIAGENLKKFTKTITGTYTTTTNSTPQQYTSLIEILFNDRTGLQITWSVNYDKDGLLLYQSAQNTVYQALTFLQ